MRCNHYNIGNFFEDDKILIFGTSILVERLCQAERIYMDGTFHSSPKLFTQLYTLHCRVGGKVFPMIYALLPDKTMQTYKRFLNGVKGIAENLNLQFKPREFVIDFEYAMMSAIEDIWSNPRIRGCFFFILRRVSGER